MILLDPNAGGHFKANINVLPHACERAVEHFRVDRREASRFITENLRKSSFVSYITHEDGRLQRLFGFNRIAFVVDAADDTVITVYPQHQANAAVLEPVHKVLIRALKAADRKEKAEERRIKVEKAQLAIKRAECELRIARTSSRKVTVTMRAEIEDIDAKSAELGRQLTEIKREKKNLAKSIVAFI